MNPENKKLPTSLIYLIVICLLLGAGTFFYIFKKSAVPEPRACTEEAKLCPDGSAVGRTGPNCEFAECPVVNVPATRIEFDKPVELKVGDILGFPGGLDVTLKAINDSRCKPGVQCIWQGELAPVLEINNNGVVNFVRLGTVKTQKIVASGFTYSLVAASENSATIIISKN